VPRDFRDQQYRNNYHQKYFTVFRSGLPYEAERGCATPPGSVKDELEQHYCNRKKSGSGVLYEAQKVGIPKSPLLLSLGTPRNECPLESLFAAQLSHHYLNA
jgi:hypothetical protein